jgi:hypothetical protein
LKNWVIKYFYAVTHRQFDRPEQEEDEGAGDFVEHGDVDVVVGEAGMPADHGDQLGPGQHDDDGRYLVTRVGIFFIWTSFRQKICDVLEKQCYANTYLPVCVRRAS